MKSKPLKDRLDESPNDNELCPVCKDLPHEDPKQSTCGHRLCGPCVEYLTRDNNCATCPSDDVKIEGFFPDQFYRREVQQKRCHCLFRENGCQWNGIVKDLFGHETECDYRDVTCPDCKMKMVRGNLQPHRENECINRLRPCEFCSEEVRVDQLEHHYSQCQEIFVECRHACGTEGIARRCMNDHLAEKCPNAPQVCTFAIQGCHFNGTRKEQEDHRRKELDCHMRLLYLAGDKTNDAVLSLMEENKDLRRVVERQDSALKEMSKNVQELRASLLEMQRRSSNAWTSGVDALASQVHEVILSLQSQEESTKRIHDEMTLLKSHMSYTKGSDERVKVLEERSSRFSYVWKIADFFARERHVSQPLYTGQCGYKMRLVTSHNGKKNGNHGYSTIVGLQFMRGEYDGLLLWPFEPRIEISLVNERKQQRRMPVNPTPRYPFFKRPEADANEPFYVEIDCGAGSREPFIVNDVVYVWMTLDLKDAPNFFQFFKGHKIT